jgi:hypothetical protein
MAGNDHISTAPKDTIGDDGDLREMREALRAGKTVTLAYDGKVYVSPDAKAPMTEAHESFIESKLGHVIELARQGYGVTVRSNGEIFADRADHLSKVMYDPDPALSEQQRGLIQLGVREGAQVRVHSDGRVEYFLAKDAKPPPADEAAKLQTWVDDEIASGRMGVALQKGETMSLNPDGSVAYIHTAPGPDPVLFPEDVGQGPATADEMDAEAKSLELGAGAGRILETREYETAAGDAVTKRDAATLEREAAKARMEAAERQVGEKQEVLDRVRAEQQDVAARATQLRDSGDLAGAEELAERWYRLRADERIAGQEIAGAQAALDKGRLDFVHRAQEVREHESAAGAAFRQYRKVEDVFDEQEDQARTYRQAATELREAERLEAAYADLQARGVPGAERVKEAAAQHRAQAEGLAGRARAYDEQGVPTSQGPTGDTVGDETAVAAFAPDLDAADQAAMSFESVADDAEIEMPEIDPGTDDSAVATFEFEMPPDDFGSEGVVDDIAQFDTVIDGPDETFEA